MAIRFGCSSCGAMLKAADGHAGRTMRCPKCSAAVVVPMAEDSIGRSESGGMATGASAAPQGAPEGASQGPAAVSSLPRVLAQESVTSRARRYSGDRAHGSRRRLLLAGLALLLVVGAVGGYALTRHKTGTLVLQWPSDQRRSAALDIDGRHMPLPRSGPLRFELSAGSHRVILRRPKYEQIEFVFALTRGQNVEYQPEWKRLLFAEHRARSNTPPEPDGGDGSANVGSGFIVTADGFILTNFHVVGGSGILLVRLPSIQDPIRASLFAQDAQLDVALLKIDVPQEAELKPLAISSIELRRADEVGAFGYPLAEQVGSGVKFNVAFIHATKQQTGTGMVVLDGRINPGNSGGPLCNRTGEVVGMVTAKSRAEANIESYGMALSGEDLQQFLIKHLPGYSPPQEPQGERPSLVWAEVDRLISPSVVMIIKVPEGSELPQLPSPNGQAEESSF